MPGSANKLQLRSEQWLARVQLAEAAAQSRFASGAPLADESTFNRRVSGADVAAKGSKGEAGGALDEAGAEAEGEGGAAVRPFRERGQRSLAAIAAHARGRDGNAAGGLEGLPEGGTTKHPPEAKGLKAAIRKGLLGLGISPPPDAEVHTSGPQGSVSTPAGVAGSKPDKVAQKEKDTAGRPGGSGAPLASASASKGGAGAYRITDKASLKTHRDRVRRGRGRVCAWWMAV